MKLPHRLVTLWNGHITLVYTTLWGPCITGSTRRTELHTLESGGDYQKGFVSQIKILIETLKW